MAWARQMTMRLCKVATASAPTSVQQKSHDLRLCRALHKRKNWLFSGSPRGAEASATLYTLIETAKTNSLEPRAYLHYLLEHLPLATTPQAITALLPTNLSQDQLDPIPSQLPR